jgi:hypothetical protein
MHRTLEEMIEEAGLKRARNLGIDDFPESRNIKDKEFTWDTFRWLLKEPFWLKCNDISAERAGDRLLDSVIHGPLCKDCKRDLSPAIKGYARMFMFETIQLAVLTIMNPIPYSE